MAARRKTGKRRTKPKRTAGRPMTSMKRLAKKKAATKRETPVKKSRKKRAAQKRPNVRKKGGIRSTIGTGTRRASSGRQAGDLQGLSTLERADSQSVDELIEEGSAFEADVVAGVEEAGNADEKEVRTHEVPEDDVPGEYLDKE